MTSLQALSDAQKRLRQATNPTGARKVLDEMTRLMSEARRALWEQEQAAKPVRTPK